MENIMNYVTENSLIIVPCLYIIGYIIKNMEVVKDKYIPIILLPIGILGSIALNGVSVPNVIQGILVTGVTVYTNQLIKQTTKEE
ncbi:MAG: phage holin family protein [Clostridium sp.]